MEETLSTPVKLRPDVVIITHHAVEKTSVITKCLDELNLTYKFISFRPALPVFVPKPTRLCIIIGGLQSTSDVGSTYYFSESHYIKCLMADNIPVLGFGLGAQLMAHARELECEKSPYKEVGVFDVKPTKIGASSAISKILFEDINAKTKMFHMHSNMVSPYQKGITVLAVSEGCPNQVMQFGNCGKYIGFQCHPEANIHDIFESNLAFSDEFNGHGYYCQTYDKVLDECKPLDDTNEKVLDILKHMLQFTNMGTK